MIKEQIGYIIECPCCGGLLIESDTFEDLESNKNLYFRVYVDPQEALKVAVSGFSEDGDHVSKIKKVTIVYEHNDTNKKE